MTGRLRLDRIRAATAGVRKALRPWIGQFPNSDQSLRIQARILRHLRRHRQSDSTAYEAGGQLFGRIAPALVTVTRALGPRATDERRRFAIS